MTSSLPPRCLFWVAAVLLGACGSDRSPPLDAGLGDGSIVEDAAPETDGGAPADFDGFVRHHMAAGGIPGLAAALLIDGEVAWRGYYGHQNLAEDIPVGPRSSFPVASLSKMFTGVLALQLVEEGLVDLDAPIDEALGISPRHPESDAPLTLRQLLTHTAGLRDNWLALANATATGSPPMSLRAFSENYLLPSGSNYDPEENFALPPGRQHRYCNAGFGVAGAVLEAAAQKAQPTATFASLAEERLFAPLGMGDSGFWPDAIDDSVEAVPYSVIGADISALDPIAIAHYPAGGLYSSLGDLERFAGALLAEGQIGPHRILDAETLAQAFALAAPELSSRQGLPFRRDTIQGLEYIGHSGATTGGSAQFLMRPSHGTGIILLTNSNAYVLARLGLTQGREALDAILERLAERLDTLVRSPSP